MPATRRPRSSVNVASIALRAALYLVVAWATIATLVAGMFPGSAALMVTLAMYTTLPLVAFVRWRGWPFYPGAAFRLFLVRPFLYAAPTPPLGPPTPCAWRARRASSPGGPCRADRARARP